MKDIEINTKSLLKLITINEEIRFLEDKIKHLKSDIYDTKKQFLEENKGLKIPEEMIIEFKKKAYIFSANLGNQYSDPETWIEISHPITFLSTQKS